MNHFNMMDAGLDILIRNCHFSFECPESWEDFDKTQNPQKRYCNVCDMHVYFCETDSELMEAIINNRCVAVINHEPDKSYVTKGIVHRELYMENGDATDLILSENDIPDFLIRKTPKNK